MSSSSGSPRSENDNGMASDVGEDGIGDPGKEATRCVAEVECGWGVRRVGRVERGLIGTVGENGGHAALHGVGSKRARVLGVLRPLLRGEGVSEWRWSFRRGGLVPRKLNITRTNRVMQRQGA